MVSTQQWRITIGLFRGGGRGPDSGGESFFRVLEKFWGIKGISPNRDIEKPQRPCTDIIATNESVDNPGSEISELSEEDENKSGNHETVIEESLLAAGIESNPGPGIEDNQTGKSPNANPPDVSDDRRNSSPDMVIVPIQMDTKMEESPNISKTMTVPIQMDTQMDVDEMQQSAQTGDTGSWEMVTVTEKDAKVTEMPSANVASKVKDIEGSQKSVYELTTQNIECEETTVLESSNAAIVRERVKNLKKRDVDGMDTETEDKQGNKLSNIDRESVKNPMETHQVETEEKQGNSPSHVILNTETEGGALKRSPDTGYEKARAEGEKEYNQMKYNIDEKFNQQRQEIDAENNKRVQDMNDSEKGVVRNKDMKDGKSQNHCNEDKTKTENHSNEKENNTRPVTRSQTSDEKERPEKEKGRIMKLLEIGKNLIIGTTKSKEEFKDLDHQEATQEENVETDFVTFCSTKQENQIVVRFHVMISPEYSFDPLKDKVFVKGLNLKLENVWDSGIEMKVKREGKKTVKGCTWLVGHTVVPGSLKGFKQDYKYMVIKDYITNLTEAQSVYEDLELADNRSTALPIINRALLIPSNFTNEYYEQFDDVILMDNSKRQEYRRRATAAFLPSFQKIILQSDYLTLENKVEKFRRVIKCHTNGIMFRPAYNHKTGFNHSYRQSFPSLTAYDKECDRIVNAWVQQLFDILNSLHEKIRNSNDEDIIKVHLRGVVYGGLFYLLLQNKIHKNLPEISKANLDILVTSLIPLISEGKCKIQEAIHSILHSPENKEAIAEDVESGLNEVIRSKYVKENPLQILRMLPTFHFLRGNNEIPISQAQDKKANYWGFFKISISVRSYFKCLTDDRKKASSFFEELKLFSRVDPILPLSYLRCLQFEEFLKILESEESNDFFSLPPLIATALTWIHPDEVYYIDPRKLMTHLEKCVQNKLKNMVLPCVPRIFVEDLEIITKHIFAEVLKNCNEKEVGLFITTLKVLIASLQFISIWFEAETKTNNEDVTFHTKCLEVLTKQLLAWIEKNFEKKHATLTEVLSVVSQVMWTITKSENTLKTQIEMKVVELINQQRRQPDIIEAYTELDTEELHPFIKKALEEKAMVIAEKEIASVNEGLFRGWFGTSWSTASKMKKMCKLYAHALDPLMKKLTLMDIASVLNFVMYNDIFGSLLNQENKSRGLVEEYFPVKSKKTIKTLMNAFTETVKGVAEGKETVGLLQTLSSVPENVFQLRIRMANSMIENQISPHHLDLLELRKGELQIYKETSKGLVKFLQTFDGEVENLTNLIKTFPDDNEIKLMRHSELCSLRNSKNDSLSLNIKHFTVRDIQIIEQYMKFQESTVFRDQVDIFKLRLMPSESYDSEDEEYVSADESENEDEIGLLFDETDHETTCEEISNQINGILKYIVKPAMKKFEGIGIQLSNLKLPLYMVDKLFSQYRNDTDGILVELITMAEILKIENSRFSGDIFDNICQYLKMTELKNVAEITMRIKDVLGIKNQFTEVAKILQAGNKATLSDDSLLNSVSKKDIKVGEIFSNLCKDDIEGIEIIEECQALIHWLLENMENFQEFKFFVDLASISAGESDTEVDRVTFMQSSITAYSAFIWDLGPDSEVNDFLNATQVLQNAIKLDINIREKFRDTNRHLPWIKAVKEQHGSVETSSLQQVEAINRTGVYKIGQWDQNAENMLKLSFQQVVGVKKGNQEYQKDLNEIDVNELRSKLMLISKSSESSEAVETFVQGMLHAQRIKNVGCQLYNAGCNLFRKMIVIIYCDPNKKIKVEVDLGSSGLLSGNLQVSIELPILAEFLEQCLGEWNDHLASLRHRYSSLNNFRTDQLVELSISISKCMKGETLPLHAQMLLERMSNQVNDDMVRDVFSQLSKKTVVEEDDFEMVEIDGDGLIKMLMQDYSIGEEVAQACIMANIGVSNVEDLFQWCLENDINEELIENNCNLYIEAKHKESQPTMVDTVEEKPTFSEATKVMVERVSRSEVNLQNKLKKIWNYFLDSVESEETSDFLSLDKLGIGLQKIFEETEENIMRKFPSYLTTGKPNLVVCPAEDVHSVALTFYNHDPQKPLPTSTEVLLCTENTAREDVELICKRAFSDKKGRIFLCMYAEKLDFNTSIFIENLFLQAEITNREYQLIFICTKDNVQHSYLATALDKYRVQVPEFKDNTRIKSYIEKHLMRNGKNDTTDPTKMRIIQSTHPGMGKSLQVKRAAERLNYRHRIIQLHEKNVDLSCIIRKWQEDHRKEGDILYHIDITPAVQTCQGNDLLFSLVVLKGIQDAHGNVWNVDDSSLYMFEMTKRKQESETFFALLPKTTCLSPGQSLDMMKTKHIDGDALVKKDSESSDFYQLLDDNFFKSSEFQRPTRYLQMWLQDQNLDSYNYNDNDAAISKQIALEVILNSKSCPIGDPSYGEINNFLRFLNVQLESCEKSIYCNLGDDWSNLRFKNFVVKFMLHMAKDFATRSIDISDESSIERPVISERRKWESSSHPYIFFNNDATMTFFNICLDSQCNLIDPVSKKVLENTIMTKQLYELLKHQNKNDQIPIFNMDFDKLSEQLKLRVLCRILGVERQNLRDRNNMNGELVDPDPSYKLTSDNVKKLLAIYMRLKCKIPVVVMGETGSGKTRMIKYLCDLMKGGKNVQNMIIMKVHGGLTKKSITLSVEKSLKISEENKKLGVDLTVCFFDEANTTSAIGSIKELMADRLNDGTPLPSTSTLQFIAAVNPYRTHSETMIRKLEGAGLGYHIKAESTTDNLGTIPLRRLVYRVHALPLSLFPLIWDFGTVNETNEEKYIYQMVRNVGQELKLNTRDENSLTKSLSMSQQFMRERTDECSFVSLRDVERTLKIFQWFHSIGETLFPMMQDKYNGNLKELSTFSVECLLALGVSYFVRLEKERGEYARKANACLSLGNNESMQNVIESCQNVFVEELKLPPTISKNEALKENVWMMTLMIQLKIPLFLVGKPGSSKSLAKNIVGDIMQGPNSYSTFFKNHFKEIHMVSFQCSPLATSEGIVGTFRQCQKYQMKKDLEKLTSVVILDEVGLAEDSPKMPLKALHPLLEDGCIDDDIPTPDKKVAFIGISNWALDPAKMNRGIFLSRIPPEKQDLIKIGRGIGEKKYSQLTDHLVPDLAEGYMAVYEEQNREYFGLRDFYSLIKMVSGIAEEKKTELSYKNIETCVKRNFGGYFGKFHPSDVFLGKIKSVTKDNRHQPLVEKDLIMEALSPNTNKKTQESRYVLLLTKNNAALNIIQMPKLLGIENTEILFGSSFPGDQEYSQICANINRIKICMETGTQVVLCNLENLYESLYDALNQQYSYMGGSRYVDLGLGTHRVKCRVHQDFRLILVAEDQDVYERFPIPLINRLEKHYLGMETIMDPKFDDTVDRLKHWIRSFCEVDIPLYKKDKFKQYTESDNFIGYHDDAIPGLILELTQSNKNLEGQALEVACKERLLLNATPDSILRVTDTELKNEAEDLFNTYFVEQCHDSLSNYIQSLPAEGNNLVQVTTHSRILTASSKADLSRNIGLPQTAVTLISLQQFKTEDDFRKKLENFFQKVEQVKDGSKRVLVTQVDASENEKATNLVECAKYILQGLMKKIGQKKVDIFLVIHLTKGASFSGYPCKPWTSLHIDELKCPQSNLPMHVKMMKNRSIHDILKAELEEEPGILSPEALIESMVPKAASMVKGNPARATIRIDKFLNAFKSNKVFRLITISKLVDIIGKHESRKTETESKNWLKTMSIYSLRLKEGNTFRSSVWGHLQESITPALAQILTIDSNENLDLFESKETWRRDFFLEMYRCFDIQSTYERVESTKEVKLKHFGYNNISVKVPFSWNLIDLVDHCGFKLLQDEESHLELLQNSTLGLLLIREFKSNPRTMPSDYISDFLAMKVNANNKDELNIIGKYFKQKLNKIKEDEQISKGVREMKLGEEDISQTRTEGEDNAGSEYWMSNISPVFIHSEYEKIKSEIGWFSAIMKIYPSISSDVLKTLEEKPEDRNLALVALHAALEVKLTPKFEDFELDSSRDAWSKEVFYLQPLVEQMMKVRERELPEIKQKWTRIQVLRLFLEHVLPTDVDPVLKKTVLGKLKTMWMSLKNPDLKTYGTFKNVIQVLKIINVQAAKLHFTGGVNECIRCGEIPIQAVAMPCGHVGCEACIKEFMTQREGERRCPGQRCKNPIIPVNFEIKSTVDVAKAVVQHGQFRSTLNLFFMDLIDNFCFTAGDPPEKKVVESLLEFVTAKTFDRTDMKRTKELSPFDEHGIDSTPVVRSFILQLCLKCDQTMALGHIEEFIKIKASILETEDEIVEFYLLYMNCVEDFLIHKTFDRDGDIETILTLQSLQILKDNIGNNQLFISDPNVSTLDAMSKIRFAIGVVAKDIAAFIENPEEIQQNQYKKQLLAQASQYVQEEKIPCDFLVKEICLKYRKDAISVMKKTPELKNFLPKVLQYEGDSFSDIFHTNGNQYGELKDTLLKSVIEGDFSEFKNYLDNNIDQKGIVTKMLLSIFHCFKADEEVNVTDKICESLTNVLQCQNVQTLWYRTPKVSDVLKTIVQAHVHPRHKCNARELDVNKLAFLFKTNLASFETQSGLADILSKIVFNPSEVMVMFLPGMPHDALFETFEVMKKEIDKGNAIPPKFFLCPNNHLYTIGDCTQPNQKGKCRDCGADIGAEKYGVLIANNKRLDNVPNNTKPGYIQHDQANEGIREMTAFETTITKLVVNLCLFSASDVKHVEVGQLCHQNVETVNKWLLGKINVGISEASRHIGKSQDDIILLISSLANNVPLWKNGNFELKTHKGRCAWEVEFSKAIQENMQQLEKTKREFETAVKNDESSVIGCSHKFLNQENNNCSIQERLWQVRDRVTADNLLEWLVSTNRSDQAKTLLQFLKKGTEVNHLCNLPQILELQKFLLDRMDGRIALSEVEDTSIRIFSESIESTFRDWFLQKCGVLLRTWNALSTRVKNYGGMLGAEISNMKGLDQELNIGNTPASFVFQSSHGKGICSYAMTMMLMETHNNLVQSDLPPIHPFSAEPGHLATCTKSQVQTLLLAHTRYTLQKNGVTKEEYDIINMDRRVRERYVQSRPRLLENELVRIQFLEDRSGFQQDPLSAKIKQGVLTNSTQHQLETEVKDLPQLCSLLDSVLTARDFLLQTGGEPNSSLETCLRNLRLYRGENIGIKDDGPLRHVLLCQTDSVLDFLLLVRAKRMIRNGQSPFEQVVPVGYRASLPEMLIPTATDCLTSIPHTWLLPNLFNFIWTRLRTQPIGDTSGQPDWPLKDTLEAHVEDGEDFCKNLDGDLLVQHAVEFFKLIVHAA